MSSCMPRDPAGLRVYLSSAIRPCAGGTTRNIVEVATAHQCRGRCVLRVQEKACAPAGALLRARRGSEDRGRDQNRQHVESSFGYTATAAVHKDARHARTFRRRGESIVDGHCTGRRRVHPAGERVSAEAGGSGRGSSGEGNCSSLHMEMYLGIRVVRVLQG